MQVKINEFKVAKQTILRDLNFDLKAGERVMLIGESGCGKSSLFQLIREARKNFDGYILGVGEYRYIPQNLRIDFHGIALDLITSKLVIKGYRRREAEEIAAKMLTVFGLGNKKYMQANLLSGGEKKRFQAAYLLCDMSNYNFIIADEADSGLDFVNAFQFQKAMSLFAKKQSKSLLYISHSCEDRTMQFFDRLLILKKISNQEDTSVLAFDTPTNLRNIYPNDTVFNILLKQTTERSAE